MRRVSLFITSFFIFNLLIIPAHSAVKYGDKCAKVGQTATASGKKFTCIKSGKNLIWNKGVLIAKPTANPSIMPSSSSTPLPTPTATSTPKPSPSPTPTIEQTTFNYPWRGLCDKDPWVPAQWKEYEEFALRVFGCSRPYRFVEVTLPSNKPSSEIINTSLRSNVSVCKLADRKSTRLNSSH